MKKLGPNTAVPIRDPTICPMLTLLAEEKKDICLFNILGSWVLTHQTRTAPQYWLLVTEFHKSSW